MKENKALVDNGRIKVLLILMLGMLFAGAMRAQAYVAQEPAAIPPTDEQIKYELQDRLCKETGLDCEYVLSVFNDPRVEIYGPPGTLARPSAPAKKEREKNPYLTKRFGLLSWESLERCRLFVNAHAASFATAYEQYGVPKEVICGHLRIETNFGIPTKLSPHPLGTRPAINQLLTLYVRNSILAEQETRSFKRLEFAFLELSKLLAAGKQFGWDLFEIPGSPTGAIGLAQFEPSSLSTAIDGNGDGRVNLFDPNDAIVSIANYLVTRGWDHDLEHQKRAIYAYYGGDYKHDPYKYYMKAVLRYANEVRLHLKQSGMPPQTYKPAVSRQNLPRRPARRPT